MVLSNEYENNKIVEQSLDKFSHKNQRNSEEELPNNTERKNPYIKPAVILAFILLFATFVALPHQSALAHDSGSHDFCFDQTLNALDWLQDALFPVITFFYPDPIIGFIFKLVLSVVIIGGGMALNLLCAPQLSPPPKAFRVSLPCNYAGIPDTPIAELKGFRVYPDTEISPVGNNLPFFDSPRSSWDFDTDDRPDSATPPTEHPVGTFPVLGSFRDSIYTEPEPDGDRLGFTTWYAAKPVLLWIEYQIGTIIGLIFGLLPLPKIKPIPDKIMKDRIFPILEILVGVAFTVALTIFGNYKQKIAEQDVTGGTIAHPMRRNFEIFRDSTSAVNLNEDQKEILGNDFKLYSLGQNEIAYKGKAGNKEDPVPAKFYFNVIDPMPPYVGFKDLNVTIVEANAHWGFVVEPKEWKKMGFNDFVKWDNCNPEPRVEYSGKSFLPMALITEDKEKFREAQNAYDLEFEKSKNTSDARKAYIQNVTLTEENKEEFNAEWKAIDHPEGYDVYVGGLDPTELTNEFGDVSPADVGNEDFIYDDDEIVNLINLQVDANEALGEEIRQQNSDEKKLKVSTTLVRTTGKILQKNIDGLDEFAGSRALKGVTFPSNCDSLVTEGTITLKDGLICTGGLVGSTGISIAQSKLDNQYAKKVMGVQTGAQLDDAIEKLEKDLKKLNDDIEKQHRTTILSAEENENLLKKAQATSDELDAKNKLNADLKSAQKQDLKNSAKFAVAGKVLVVGIAAATTFINPPVDTPPETVKVDGLESFWNQTVIVIDTTPPDVLVPEFEAIEVPNLTPQELEINPPEIFDVADPSPDLFHNFADDQNDLDFDICHKKTGKCGWIPLGDEDFLEGTFPVNTVTTIEWFGRDFSENESPIRNQIVNVKLEGTNLISIALNQTHNVGGFDFNPSELTIAAINPDNDPVKYLVESNPEEGVLKSPLDPVFQNKIRETGDTGSLKGLTFVNPNDGSSDFVYFPDSKNNRVMKIFTESGTSHGIGHVELGFTFSNGTEFPTGLLPFDISPEAITQVDATTCPLTYLIADWKNEKIYNATLGNCSVHNSTALISDFFDVTGLFSDPKYFEIDGNDIYVSDAGLGSIVKTTIDDISSANSLNLPTDVLSLKNNKAWVADSGNNRIIEIDVTDNTSKEKSFPKNLAPTGITANATHLFVSHESGKKITIVNQTDIEDSFEIPKTGNFNLGKSERIAFQDDLLYVTDSQNDKIHVLNTTDVIDSIVGPDDDSGFFDDPVGISSKGDSLFVADSGNHRIVKINLADPFFEDTYTNSSGNWQTFGNNVTVNDSSSTGVLKFTNVQSGSGVTFSGAYTELTDPLPARSWTASFDLETQTNSDNSNGHLWLLTNQIMANPDLDSINALGVILDSSKLFIYQKNSTDSLVSSEGISIENNTSYVISLTRNTEQQVKLVASESGTILAPSPILNVSKNIVDLHVLQHSNNIQVPFGDSLNFTIDNSVISPVKFSWLGSCVGGLDCIDAKMSDGFLCTDDSCEVDNSPGSENGQFDRPLGITHNGTNFFVTDAGNQRIQIFDTAGHFLEEFGDSTKFIYPAGISLDDQNKIYVADNLGNSLNVFEGEDPFDLTHKVSTKQSQEDFLKVAELFQLSLVDIEINSVSLNPNTGDSWILGTESNQTKIFNLKNPSLIGNVIEGISLESLGLVEPTYFAIDSNNKFLLVDRQKDGGAVIDFEIQGDTIDNISVIPLGPLILDPVGIEIENENGSDFVYISDWTKGQEKIVKFERNNIHNGAFEEPPEDVIDISNLVNIPKDIGFVTATNPCLDDGSHCDPPSENRRITIADQDELGPKIISIRTDKGIIDTKKIIAEGEVSISSIDYGVDSQENILFAIATNKTLFSYDPWNPSHELKKSLDFSIGSLNPDSFAFNPLPFGSKGNFTDGSNDLISPRGMAFGPVDGNLYVSSMETDVIKKYNGTSGNFIENFVDEEFLDRPYGLAFHPDTNNLFVGNFGNGCIVEFDGDSGEHIQDIQCERDWGMAAPKGIAFDSNGILYASAFDQNSVIRFDLELDGNDELKLPEEFILPDSGYLNSPDGLAFDNQDNLYVVNPNEVVKFDSEGNFIEIFANSTIVANPIGLYFDKENEFMFVTNNVDNSVSDDSIKKLDLGGNLISTISGKEMKSPYYLTMDNLGNVFTGNELDGIIVHYGESMDNIYVADWGNNENQRKIFAFTKNGTQIKEQTINLQNIATLSNPGELAIDSNGNLYITDHNGDDARIVVIDRINKELLKEIPLSEIKLDRRECTEIPGEDPPLCRYEDGTIVPVDEVNTSTISVIPSGMSINSLDEMFLSDWGNNRIVRLFTNGNFIDLYKFNNTFADPEDIAITLDHKDWNTGDNQTVVLDESTANHQIRFSVLDRFSILEDGPTNEVKSLNYFSLMQEKQDFSDDIESIEGLTRCIIDSCDPPTNNSTINNFSRETYTMLSSQNGDVKIGITNTDSNRFINSTHGPDTIPLDFSMEPEGLATYGDQKLAITDWNRESIRGYDLATFELIDENIVEEVDFPPTASLEFADIDIDQDRLFIADNFEVRIRQIENILDTPTENLSSKLTLDQFIFMSSITVNEKDQIYLGSQENKTIGNYDFRGNLIGESPIKFDSGIQLNLTDGVNLDFTEIVLSDFAIDSEEPIDTIYVLLDGELEISFTEDNDSLDDGPPTHTLFYNTPSGVIAHGKYDDFVNSEFNKIEWIFFQKSGQISGHDDLCVYVTNNPQSLTFFNESNCPSRVPLSNHPGPSSISFDETTKKLYFNLDDGSRIAAFDMLSPTCQSMPTIFVHTFEGDIYLPTHTFIPITIPAQKENVLFCGSLNDKTQSTITGASIKDIVNFDGALFLSDDQGHKVHRVNITNGLEKAESYNWMGKCEVGDECNKNDMTSNGFSCKMNQSGLSTFVSNTTSCGESGLGDFNGQFRSPTELAVDMKTGDIFTTDFPINLKTGEPNPRVQKFSDKGFFIEDFISTLSRPELTNDPELLTDQSAGFFDNDNIVGIAKASNYFYAADGRKVHFFDTNPFETAIVDKNQNMSFSNVTYQYFLEEGTDSFEFKVSDGFDESNSGTVTMDIADTDCDDDGFENSIDRDANGHGCSGDSLPPLFEDSELLGFSDGTASGFINSSRYDTTKNHILIRDEPSPEGLFIESDAESEDPVPIVMCDGEYWFLIEAGDRLLVNCEDSEVRILRGQNVDFTFLDDEGRESKVPLSYLDRVVFVPEGPSFKSLSSVSVVPKILTVSFNDEIYEYVDALEPDTELVVDTSPPKVVCPEPLTLEADVVEGIHYDKSSKNNTDAIDAFVEFVSSNSTDMDNGNPNRGAPLLIKNDLPTILQVGDTLVSFNATDGIGNMGSCTQIIKVEDTIAPEVVLPIGELEFVNAKHDDVFAFNFKELIVEKSTIFDRYVNWTGNTPGEKAILFDESSKRRPMCMPHPGTEFTVNTTPVGCEGLDDFFNAGFSNFNMTVIANSTVTIDEAIASTSPTGDIITIRFSHETNKPDANTKEEIDSLLNTGGKSLGSSYSGFYQNPSTLVITIDDPSGSDLTLDGSTIIDIENTTAFHSSSGILNSSSNPTPLTGSFEKSRSPFITDFIANDPSMDDIGDAVDEEDKMVNMEYSPGDVLTIRFSDPTNKAGFDDEILNATQVDSLFEFSPSKLGDDYTGSWLNDRTFVVTIKERNTYTSDFPLLGTSTVKVVSPNLRNVDEKSEPSNSTSWPLQGSFGRFSTFKNVEPGFSLATTQPSGIVTEITFPNGGGLTSLSQIDGAIDVDENSKLSDIIGNILDIKSPDKCEDGCEIKFTYTQSDLQNTGSGKIVVVHDADGDRIISSDEILETEIEKIGPDTFTATAKLFSLSAVTLAKLSSGGGGGDSSPPDIQDLEYSGSSGGYSASGIGFNNNLEPIIAETGEPFTITLTVYENLGLQAFQHISLYMNLRGLDDQVHESDTYIRWDKGLPVSVRDPHGYFADADVEVFEVGNKIQVVFTFNFALPMETSDVIIRTWDNKRNSWDSNFPGLLTVTGSPFFGEPLGAIDLGDFLGREASSGNATSIFPDGFLERWNAFSDGEISDRDLLELLGLEGQTIPDWFKETSAKWFMEQKISEQEFIDALEYLSNKNILR